MRLYKLEYRSKEEVSESITWLPISYGIGDGFKQREPIAYTKMTDTPLLDSIIENAGHHVGQKMNYR